MNTTDQNRGTRTLFERQVLRTEMLERGTRLPDNVRCSKGARALLWTMPEAWEAVRTAADKMREHFGAVDVVLHASNDELPALFVDVVWTGSAKDYDARLPAFEAWWADNINADNLLHSVEFR